ncbi:MAG: ABC transporter permease, partial [Alphaproteobacteria bacterium]|nr:ABC transporter permease [Alphaproteobacteria bacterium]
MMKWLMQPGVRAAIPAAAFLLIGFAGPLLMVMGYSFMPPRTFSLAQAPTFANFISIVTDSYYLSFVWSVFLSLTAVTLLLVISYPVAYGMAKMFGPWANVVTMVIVVPLLVSENIRLFGWVLVLLKNGIADGSLQLLFGVQMPSFLYTVPAIVLGLVYVYLPFMLFPLVIGLSMVPDALKEAASDLGASRLQIFREVEVPLAMPGIMIGCMLTFILSLGSLAESKILGGQVVIMIADDIEASFTFAQNWPKGSMLSAILIV